jgi:putative methionine-R-sulfoxide reductase with GAF domain
LILADISRVLSQRQPGSRVSPLEKVAELLADGRHYGWVGIYLTVNGNSDWLLGNVAYPVQFSAAGTRKKIIVAMKIAGREVGSLHVESERDNAFGAEERVLLERVAGLVAKFLVSNGKYLVRKATHPEPTPRAAAA